MLGSPSFRVAISLPVLLIAASAAAQDDGLPPVQMEFSNGATLRFYGQINKGILQYDDGIETKSYGLIDNANSGTRFGLKYTQKSGDWTFENVDEFGYAPFSTGNTNLENPNGGENGWSNDNIRKIDFTFANDRYGKFWLGQGSMATDGILEIDLSGTDYIAYSGVADSASAQIIRFADPALANDLDRARDRRRVRKSRTATAGSASATTPRRSRISPSPQRTAATC